NLYAPAFAEFFPKTLNVALKTAPRPQGFLEGSCKKHFGSCCFFAAGRWGCLSPADRLRARCS
ncbi:MAG: hypothetical protein K9J85_05835, partial [Desulfobacteraceae bacterium]|nr:hypothetical protein [Desulfobacteraceae bacterium]